MFRHIRRIQWRGLRCLLPWALAAGLAITHGSSHAQSYPDKLIKLIVPFSAGGGSDHVGRVFAQRMSKVLGQEVIVENKVGASGMIGADFVAKSAPDGYTIMVGTNTTNAAMDALFKKVPYNVQNDFAPISFLGIVPGVLLVNKDFPVNSLAEFIDYARSHPGKVNYAWTSSSERIYSAMLATMTGVELFQVPYKNASQAHVDLLSGEVQMHITDLIQALPRIKSGTVKALGVTTRKRSAATPDIPTIAEAAQLPDYDFMGMFAAFAPAGTPPNVIQKLNDAIREASEDPKLRATLTGMGMDVQPSTAKELGQRMRQEYIMWNRMAKQVGIEPQ